jgi:hypothetical protein
VVPISATAAAVVAWASVVAARAFIVVATSASFLAVAASRVETLSCVLPMKVGGSGCDCSVEVGARVLEVGARVAEGVNRANTIVELAVKGRQSCIGSAGVLHESLSPNVGVDGLLQVGEVGGR